MLILWFVIASAILFAKAVEAIVSIWLSTTKWYMRLTKKIGNKYMEQYLDEESGS